MIPQKLTISGFLSYREPVEIDFRSFDLACISGANGAGKSSLLDAITWVLFGRARSRDQTLICNDPGVNAAEVSLIFEYEGNFYRVQRAIPRNRTSLLEFHIAGPYSGGGEPEWRPLSERTLSATQKRIEETLRMDYDTFINASFFLQGKADQFTQQRPGERKRILGSILGLEIWETYRQRSVERRRDEENEMLNLDGRLAEIRAELAEEDERREALARLQGELDEAARIRTTRENDLENVRRIAALLEEKRSGVDALQREVDKARRRTADLEARQGTRRVEVEKYTHLQERAAEIREAYEAWQQARRELEVWEKSAEAYRTQEKKRQGPLLEIEAEKARLQQEMLTLQAEKERLDSALAHVPELLDDLAQARAEEEAHAVRAGRRKELETDREVLRQRLSEARAENPRLAEEMNRLKARIAQLQESEDAPCPVCAKPLSAAERAGLIGQIESEGKALGDRWRANRDLLQDAEAQMLALESEIGALESAERDRLACASRAEGLHQDIQEAEKRRDAWQDAAAPRQAEIARLLSEGTYAPEARRLLQEIERDLKETGYDLEAHETARRMEQEGRRAEEEFRLLAEAQANLARLENELAELQADLAAARSEAEERELAWQTGAETLAQQEALAPNLALTERELFQAREQEAMKIQALGAARQKVNVLQGLKERSTRLEGERQEIAVRIGHYRTLERAFSRNGIPALLIEQAIPQIEEKANEILGALSDDSMSVRFITQTQYRDANRSDLKETLDIQITDTAGSRDYEMYSGGEAFRVNFAVRLALAEVLAQRAGARLQTLVIDEGFGSQDADGRQRLIDAINRVRTYFEKILVITHIEEIKELFPARIEVEKTPAGSRIRMV